YLAFFAGALGKPLVWHRRCLIVADESTEVQVVEDYEGSAGVSFTNAVTEIVMAENAAVQYYRLQRESRQAFHVATVQVRQQRNSPITSHSYTNGGPMARTN